MFYGALHVLETRDGRKSAISYVGPENISLSFSIAPCHLEHSFMERIVAAYHCLCLVAAFSHILDLIDIFP